MNHKITTAVTVPPSARLCYRLMDDSDAEALFELDQDEAVMRYINGGKISSMQDIRQRMLPRMNSYRDPATGLGIWQVKTRPDYSEMPDCYLGWVIIRPMDFFVGTPKTDDVELGWRFRQSSWGYGFATEAAKAVADAVTAANPAILYWSAIAMPDNKASTRVMEKLGLSYVKQGLHKDPLGDVEVVYYQKKLVP
jgi:RimJ/RimL family protein N-acetyltransferase